MPGIDSYSLDAHRIDGVGVKPTLYAKSGTVNIPAGGSATVTLPEGASEFIAATAGPIYPYGIIWDGQAVTAYPPNGNTQGYLSFNANRTILTIRGSNGGETSVNYATVSI